MPATQRVLITGAAGQIGSFLVPLVCSGAVCGASTPVELVLCDIPAAVDALKGLVMEIEDCAYPLLLSVKCTGDIEDAFEGVTVAIMVGGFPRLKGMDRSDLLYKNADIFVAAGKALEAKGSADCKVLVVANPANTNALIMQQNAPKVPAANFTCLTRLDCNRAVAQAAMKAGAPIADVSNVVIWGNHSNTMVPDLSLATIAGKPAAEVIADAAWVSDVFTPTVQTRGAAVIAARNKSSAMSAANAAANHINDWLNGTPAGTYVSMGVVSQGEYGIAQGIVFSYPCVVTGDGKYTVKQGLPVSEATMAALKASEEELLGEKAIFDKYRAEKGL